MRPDDSYAALVAEAEHAAGAGWDFGFLAGRVVADALPWAYEDLAATELTAARRVVDLDTGGGELLAALVAGVPGAREVIAVEPHAPNLPVAAERLTPLGVAVRPSATTLPVADAWADLVLNRHGALDPVEVARILSPGGRLLSQQVGTENDAELNVALGAPPGPAAVPLADLVAALRAAGLRVEEAVEAWPEHRFADVGAVVFQLRMVAWQVPGFDPVAYEVPLRRLHARLAAGEPLPVRSHRYLLRAVRPR